MSIDDTRRTVDDAMDAEQDAVVASDRDTRRTVEAVWRIEGRRITASVAKMTGDLGLAEDVAQEAVLEALQSWPDAGIPANPGAWLTAVAKRRVIDAWRRRERLDDRYAAIAHTLDEATDEDWEPIDDDVLRLVFTACHPALSRESQVALTLRVVAGLSTDEIARMLLTTVPTVQARITRAKKSLTAAHVPFETPDPSEWPSRLGAVLGVVYLVFTEGYAATGGGRWVRPDLADEALRLGRIVSGLLPREPEPLALVALMEFQRSRFAARETRSGEPVLLADQDRSRWDHGQIARAVALLGRADAAASARRTGRGAYALQAAIAGCHAIAPSVADTDWDQIVLLYEVLGRVAPSPVVELNHAVAVSMASGPAAALPLVDALEASGALRGSHLVPSVRGELLARLGRRDEARSELLTAAALTANAAQQQVLRGKAEALR
ncbi:RNA polymerase sigma factor (sigma-70 family) [Microbacterium terrae]|uniref:RNA polymerase sigma factor n=2 Tax=Microbacterium terrae TaxID=69369 RepID=A0A0M2GW36_9MICO|nr:RNA polymerase sigma factor [Microbacterium terrae]MBP1076544.1 RNA polymerase sigma factor (sigma-70 family) [Microbacterium terrae]GLJ97373.1 RNA polymerase sigma factor [Microbacterium terrae]